MLDAAPAEPLPDLKNVRPGAGPQAVVDGEHAHPPAAQGGPIVSKQAKRHAVRATGDRDGKMGRRLKRPHGSHCRIELFGIYR